MNLLALETATDACSVALRCGNAVHARHCIAPRRHTELVIGMLDEVLAEAAVERAAIDVVAYGHGPGSFTGVRIAATLAQGIALARELPVVAVSSLAALAAGAQRRGHRGRIVAALDARRGEIYAATFSAASGSLQRLGPDAVFAPEALLLPGGGDWLAVGNAWEVYAARLPAALNALARDAIVYPDAIDIAALAVDEFAAGRGRAAEAALPLYLRGALD
ncbi:MAG: tRNA (adenosine(37)-N6)-threonylcarbamoyltransferase complex dimerization subunit type 1 TsaB [Gammaproteobacteria bacterium]